MIQETNIAPALPVEFTLSSGIYRVCSRNNPHYPNQCALEIRENGEWRQLSWDNDGPSSVIKGLYEFDSFIANASAPVDQMPSAVAAAQWWTNILSQGGGKKDNGDAMQSMFANALLGDIPAPPSDRVERFGQLLCNFITNELRNRAERGYMDSSVSLHCDYAPCTELWRLGTYCKLPTTLFPWKTSMHVYQEHVVVGYGYKAEREMIFGEPAVHTFVETSREKQNEYTIIHSECSNCGLKDENYADLDNNPRYGWTHPCRKGEV